MQTPRIAVLTAGEIFGGAERQILTFLETSAALLRDPPELIVFHDGELAARARERGSRVHVLGARGVLDTKSLSRLRAILKEGRYDAVNVHGYRAATYLALAAGRKRLKVVKTEHGSVESGTGSFVDRAKARTYRRLEVFAARWLCSTIVYVTEDLKTANAQAYRGLPQHVIYNGIAALDRTAASRPSEFANNAVNLVVVGRLEPVKGIDIAIQALSASTVHSLGRLHIVGTGPSLEALQRLSTDLGVSNQISFAGFRTNVHDYVAHADALLIPSRHEGLPYTLLEALALGTPVIAACVGGLAEVLTAERTALLFEPGNATALASAVLRLTQNTDLRTTLVSEGLRLVATRFTARAMTERYLQVIDDLTTTSPYAEPSSTR